MTEPRGNTVQPYGLTLRPSRRGNFTVYRFNWTEFPGPGEWCRVDERCGAGRVVQGR
ncbi:MAG TPA: hypothetical protein VFZ00_28445 [Solirubrobacter sp.]|nr:hypothetical protein [Solirubrobacter sp.]